MPKLVPSLRPVLAATGVFALAVALSACGSSSASKQSSQFDAAYKFSRCMRAHGLKDFPDPQVTGNSVKLVAHAHPGEAGAPTPQQMEAAQNACKHFMAASAPKLSPQEKVAREEQVLKFAACMRRHGIDVHASAAGGGVQLRVGGGPTKPGPNPESPSFTAAQKACQGLLPMKGGGPGASSSHAGGGSGPSLSTGG